MSQLMPTLTFLIRPVQGLGFEVHLGDQYVASFRTRPEAVAFTEGYGMAARDEAFRKLGKRLNVEVKHG